jgi:hypothetical protein
MKIEEMCDMLRIELRVSYIPGAVGPWIAELVIPYGDLFYKRGTEDIMARHTAGHADSPRGAILNLIKRLGDDPDFKMITVVRSTGERHVMGTPNLEFGS